MVRENCGDYRNGGGKNDIIEEDESVFSPKCNNSGISYI